jgi:hypothetical protein
MSLPAGVRRRAGRVMARRYAFAWAYLACYLAAELVWVLLTPQGAGHADRAGEHERGQPRA